MAPPPSSSPPPVESTPPNPAQFLHSACRSMQSLTANILSHLPFPSPLPNSPPRLHLPPLDPSLPPPSTVTVPFSHPLTSSSSFHSSPLADSQEPSASSSAPAPAMNSMSPGVRIQGLTSLSGSEGGPAFVGQVFSMLDPSGNGLMTVTSPSDLPFFSNRMPGWIKRLLSAATKKEQNSPVFRFFMDLSDAVTYVKRLNIPTGMVGACRLDVAYQHFKEEPHMFQFVPNEKQVKAANRLLKEIPTHGRKKVEGVPVFTAENLNIAVATADGIKWYTPYFFDKSLLDNILETSVDQHFHTLIQTRHSQRRRDVIDDSPTAEVFEESADSLFEPPEVQELLDELGHSMVPLSVVSKAAEIQLLDVVDKVLLGNKWLRKATGIQPKFPYLVDSFENRSGAFPKAAALKRSCTESEDTKNDEPQKQQCTSELGMNDSSLSGQGQSRGHSAFKFPFGDWLSTYWPKLHGKPNARVHASDSDKTNNVSANPLLPKITMVGISMGEAGQLSRANVKKTMEDLTKELEKSSQNLQKSSSESDPLFVANVGDTNIKKMKST